MPREARGDMRRGRHTRRRVNVLFASRRAISSRRPKTKPAARCGWKGHTTTSRSLPHGCGRLLPMSCGAPHHESQGQLRDSVGDGLWMMRRVGLDGELEDDEFGRAEWGDADEG